MLDLTGWPLYFSELRGYSFANVYEAPADPATRWIVVRQPHVDGHWHYSQVIRDLIGGREPVALVPPRATPNQVQILIYDRKSAAPRVAAATNPPMPRPEKAGDARDDQCAAIQTLPGVVETAQRRGPASAAPAWFLSSAGSCSKS